MRASLPSDRRMQLSGPMVKAISAGASKRDVLSAAVRVYGRAVMRLSRLLFGRLGHPLPCLARRAPK
jgi:hypothetical protein